MSFKVGKEANPANPGTNKGEFFLSSVTGKPSMILEDGRIIVFSNDGLSDRNILTNGGFNVQQRVAVASTAIAGISTTTRAGQVADRWAVTASVASNINWQQVDTSAAPETGLLARFYGSMIASTAGKKMMISQFIINAEMTHLRGTQVRVSVKTNIKVGNAQTLKLGLLQLNSSGTVDTCPAFLSGAWSTSNGTDPAWGTNLAAITPDAVTGENGTVSGSYLNISAQQTTWIRSSAVFTVPSNARNLCVVLFSDATSGTTDNISVAEFQLTQGAEIVEYVEPPLAETVLRCQRFFCKSFPLNTAPASALVVGAAGNAETGFVGRAGAVALASFIQVRFPIRMWKIPTTVTLFAPVGAGAVPYRITGTTPAVQTAAAQTGVMDYGLVVSSTGDAAGVVGDMVGVHYTADAEFNT